MNKQNWKASLTQLGRVLREKERLEEIQQRPKPHYTPAERKQTVVGGEISRDPVNKQAARLLYAAHWLSRPPPTPLYDKEKTTAEETAKTKSATENKARNAKARQARQAFRNAVAAVERMEKQMSRHVEHSTGGVEKPVPRDGEYISTSGIRIKMVDGQPMFDMESVEAFIIREVPRLIPELNPNVQAAKDTREIITELMHGIGGEMEQFKLKSKDFLNDIRQTRYAATAETSQMMTALRDVRQFFLGADYAEEIRRLREFVELCERLNALKSSGFLDKVADTMLSLAAVQK